MSYQFAIFALIVQAILFFAHWLPYRTAVIFFGLNSGGILWLRVIFALLFISFIPATIFAMKYSNVPARIFYWMSASWLGFLNFLFVASLLLWAVYFAAKVLSIPFNRPLTAAIFFALAIAAGVYGIVNANNLRIKNISVELTDLPEYWKGKTAVWISDVHLGPVRRYDFAREVAEKVKSMNPNAVFIGGDLFDGGTVDLDNFTQPFSEISASDGIYLITGNHEEFSGSALYLDAVRQAGIKVLDNEMVVVNGLQIAGVNWKDAENSQKYRSVIESISFDKNLPSVLLKHAPTNLDIANERGISFQISGHTHVGQIFPINLITGAIYGKYNYGLNKFKDLQVYTSSGAGTWGPPMRAGNNPEIVVIKFVSASD